MNKLRAVSMYKLRAVSMFYVLATTLALFLAAPDTALAHKPSDSYLAIKVTETGVTGQWDIALRDLEYAIGLDADGNGEITWGEVKAKHTDIAAYALARLAMEAGATNGNSDGNSACALRATEHLVDDHSDGAYAVLRFAADCPKGVDAIKVRYSLFFDFDTQHKGLLRLESPAGTLSGIFAADRTEQTFELRERTALEQFLDFGREGVWHIWIGYDHVLFLLSLLLPAVLIWQASPSGRHRWQARERFKPVFWEVFKVVTSFTVAHSITLSLAALGVIELPSRLVESAIALSVLLAALNNVRPVVKDGRWMVAFAFGLIHGFGFASVLADLGLPRDALLLALVGFNLGVETGQLAIVAVFLPIAFALRRTAFYRQGMMLGGSLLVALVAAIWLAERIFDLQIITTR